MDWLEILFYSLAIVSFIIALLLSSHGNTGGIAPMAGTDIELFKKTKDRGIVKILQFILFILVFVLIAAGIIYRLVGTSDTSSSSEETTSAIVSLANVVL